MSTIMTVLGPVDADRLGVTLLHEHLIADCSFSGNDLNKKFDDANEMIEEMRPFLAAGGKTIVEQTCRGLGQNVVALQRISRESGVQIIAATGFYRQSVYPKYVAAESIDQLAARMIQDAGTGIDGSGIQPGIIAEIAGDGEALTADEEKVFRAVGRASVATGLSVSTHCWAGIAAFAMIQVLTQEGVSPHRILIGHLGVNRDLMDRTLRIADKGVYLGIDTIGYALGDFHDPDRAEIVKALIDHGHLRRITLSQDMMRRSFLKRYGGHGYDHLLKNFIPLLKAQGVTEEQIRVMLAENPRAFLSGQGERH